MTTYDNSIFRFDAESEKFVAVPGDIDPALSKARVRKYHCDKAGNVWMALDGIGLYMVGPDLESRIFFNAASDNIIGKEIDEIFEDASGNIITIVWSGTEIYRSFEPGFYATACYCEDANICAIGHMSDSTPVFCRDGEYTEFPEGYSFPSGSFACFSEGHYCLLLFPNSASLPPVYVIDGEIFTADINGYIFSVCTEET